MPATDDWGRTTPNPLSAIGVALATALAFASAQPAPSGGSIGEHTAAQWAASLKVLYDIGIIKTRVSAEGKFIPLPR
jgi:hypothetical protein